jgi:SOS-response transcriptional repressor LexA
MNGNGRTAVLLQIRDYWRDQGQGPTLEELRESLGYQVRSAPHWHVNRLVDEGFVEREAGTRRGLRLTPRGEQMADLMDDMVSP